MSTQGLVRTAVVGAGLASLTFHVPLILALPNVFHLHTVVERKPPADKEGGTIGQKFGVPVKVVTSFEEALADQEIELVVLGTPNATHYPLAKAALEAGKHVLVDKPIAPTFAECEELLALSKKVNRVLYAFQNRRWDSDFLTLLKVVQTGKLGTLIEFESHFDRFRNKLRGYWRELPAPGSGMTYDLGSHLIDQALVLFGRPDKVTAFIENVRRLGHDEVDDSFTIIFHYNPTPENQHPRKAILRAHPLSLRSPQLRYVVRGTTGSFIKTGLDPQEDQVKAGISATSSEFGVESTEIQGVLEVLDGEKTLQTRVPSERGVYTQLYSNLAAAIREGAPLAVKWEEASAVIQIIELAYQSSKEGRSIDVPPAA